MQVSEIDFLTMRSGWTTNPIPLKLGWHLSESLQIGKNGRKVDCTP